MDPEAVVYILIFLAVAIVQGVGQKRRQSGKLPPGTPGGGSPSSRPGSASPGGEAGVEAGMSRPAGQTGPAPSSSEGLIPSEVWDEILGLARGMPPGTGRPPTRGEGTTARPPARREDETLEEIPAFEARSMEDLHPRALEPSRIPKPAKVPLRPPPAPRSEPAAAMARGQGERGREGAGTRARTILGDRSKEELRKAIILREVLGPPVALRD